MSLIKTKRRGIRVFHSPSILALVLFLSLLLAACGDNPTTVPAAASTTSRVAANAVATNAAPVTINIDMVNFKFVPAEVSIPAGSTVIWTNKDSVKHTVTADDGSFDSGTMEKGATFSHKFDTAATVGYFCKFHGSAGQGMAAKLTVTTAAGALVAATTLSSTTSAAVAAVTTTATAPATTTAATTTTAAASTDTSMAGMVMPTTAPVAATAAAGTTVAAQPTTAQTASGTVSWRDDVQLTDQLSINFDTFPAAPSGRVFYGWLVNSVNGNTVNLGQLLPGQNGGLSYKYSDPTNANLLANYDKVLITSETIDPTPSAPSAVIAFSGQLPSLALVHIRHLLVSFPTAPNKTGLEVGLRSQMEVVRQHAEFMRDAQAAGDLATVKLHAQHLLNIIEGIKGPDFSPKVPNPGDGFGLLQYGNQLGYLNGSKIHASLAATTADTTALIKLHAGHIGITVDNATGWITTIRDRSLAVLKAADLNGTAPLAREILALANQSLNGVDLKGDGQILPIPGSGGVLTSYQHSQLMAGIPLTPGGAATPAAQAITTPAVNTTTANIQYTTIASAATATVAAPAAGNGQEVKIDISQFKFGSGPITIKVGTKVTWTNLDSAAHTATADNGSWDSGTLQKGQSFSFTFQKVGLVKYYCAFHGGSGGQGMSSTLNVVQ